MQWPVQGPGPGGPSCRERGVGVAVATEGPARRGGLQTLHLGVGKRGLAQHHGAAAGTRGQAGGAPADGFRRPDHLGRQRPDPVLLQAPPHRRLHAAQHPCCAPWSPASLVQACVSLPLPVAEMSHLAASLSEVWAMPTLLLQSFSFSHPNS